MESNWDIQRSKSAYHFDNRTIDPRWDCVKGIGKFTGNWDLEVANAIETARAATWRTRSKSGKPGKLVNEEEYDLVNVGADPDMVFGHLEYKLQPIFEQMARMIGLDNAESRVHVQWPGQVFIKHIDKLEKWAPDNPDSVARFMIMLTDWEQGHFNSYGNYIHQFWKAGDIHTFEWKHVPHSSANAGHTPRVSLLTTGIITDQTRAFLKQAADAKEVLVG